MNSVRAVLKCFGCKQPFRREELVQYVSDHAEIPHWYCSTCLAEKEEKDYFYVEICKLFGLKAPGAKIWTQRKRIIDTYGYDDKTIIECLKFLFETTNVKKLESLGLVTPQSVEAMRAWKREKEQLGNNVTQAIRTNIKERQVSVKENKRTKVEINPDDWLE